MKWFSGHSSWQRQDASRVVSCQGNGADDTKCESNRALLFLRNGRSWPVLPGDQRVSFNLMFHIGVLSAFFADSDFMTFLPTALLLTLLAAHTHPPPQKNTQNVPSLSPQSVTLYYWHGIWISNLLLAHGQHRDNSFEKLSLSLHHIPFHGLDISPNGVDWSVWDAGKSALPFSCSSSSSPSSFPFPPVGHSSCL